MTNCGRGVAQEESVMRLLAAGVPLSLLLDLAPATGPDSREIAQIERPSLASVAPGGRSTWGWWSTNA